MVFECKTVDWKAVKEKAESEAWASAVVAALKEGFKRHVELWPGTPPLESSDWSHYYFCTKCAAKLRFDINKPHEHICSNCGQIYSGDPYDGSWRKFVHGCIVTNLERAAVLANLCEDNGEYCNYVKDTILFYANNYHRYEIHGKHAGKGKVFPQSLTEAIFVIAVERTLRFVSSLNLFSDEDYAIIGERFFKPSVELIKPQITIIHNIHAWMQGALAAAANFLGDEELLNFSLYSEYGWFNQVRKGVTEEGMWYEIAPTYHFYTISALLSTAWVALERGINLFDEPRFRLMCITGSKLAYETGELPAYNDGWAGLQLFSYAGILEQFGGDEYIAELLGRLYSTGKTVTCSQLHSLPNNIETPATGFSRSSVSALLYGRSSLPTSPAGDKESFLLRDTGIGVLQNENVRIGLKFTPYCGGHDHNDKLSIDVFSKGELLSADPGTSGYGIGLTNKWNRTLMAHNLVIINGEKQKPGKAKLVDWTGNRISVLADEAYDGTLLKRTITLTESGFTDRVEGSAGEDSVFDWVFHCKGEIKPSLNFEPVDSFKQENGYDQITELKKLSTDAFWQVSWIMADKTLCLNFSGAKATEVFIGKCHGNTALEELGIVIVRRKGREVCFESEFVAF